MPTNLSQDHQIRIVLVHWLIRVRTTKLRNSLIEVGGYILSVNVTHAENSESVIKEDAQKRIVKSLTMWTDYVEIVLGHPKLRGVRCITPSST